MPNDFKGLFGSVFNGRRVLVTGHTGFKGSWLTLWLNALGAQVTGYALDPPTKPSLFETTGIDKKINDVRSDIRDLVNLKKVFSECKPEIVFHMAAQPLVRYSYDNPIETYETNVMGTVNLFESVRNCPSVKVVINVTSDKCYENKEVDYSYKETDPMGGYDPYSSSKGCAELITSAYRNSFFQNNNVSLSSVRAGNVIGGGDWAKDRIIPDSIEALSDNQPIIVRNPKAIRPWQHVLEPLSGYLWLASCMYREPKRFNSGWNFAPNDDSSIIVGELVDNIIKAWGSGNWITPGEDSEQVHEAKLLKLDYEKAREKLDWSPVYNVKEAVDTTVAWYKNFYEQKRDFYEYTLNDISNYTKKAEEKMVKWVTPINIVGV